MQDDADAGAEPRGPLPKKIMLPASFDVPVQFGALFGGGDIAAGLADADPAAVTLDSEGGLVWQTDWVSPFVELHTDRERSAWFHFCHGHHLEFLYWEATTAVCRLAEEAVRLGRLDDLAHHLARIVDLVEGSGAMLSFCGAFDPEVYDPLLRVSMARQRDDFSGDMSSDFLAMATAKRDLYGALEAGGATFASEIDQLRWADRYWYHHHNQVVVTLHPGDSLLKEKVDDLARRSDAFDFGRYVANVVHGEQARRDYDDYFGVVRVPTMALEHYWTQALEKIAMVHRHFRLEPDVRRRLVRGDAALLAVISGRIGRAESALDLAHGRAAQ